MLQANRDTFAFYAGNHRAKAARWDAERLGCSDEVECERLARLITDTTAKAVANEELVKEIDLVLAGPSENVLARTAEFADIVHGHSISHTAQQTQIGVHFEEVAEMTETLTSSDPAIQQAITDAYVANENLGNLLKMGSNTPTLTIMDRVAFIDSVADQLVTVTLSATLQGMDPIGALMEVNRSNFSKLTDGRMAIDPTNNKWIKGPGYTPPKLRFFA